MTGRPSAALNVRISASLRRRLEAAREHSGRTLTGEVEARLRLALRQSGGDGLLLLRLDKGLMAHVEALASNGRGGIFGDVEQTAVYLIRSRIIDIMGNENLRELVRPHLREPWRTAGDQVSRARRKMARAKEA